MTDIYIDNKISRVSGALKETKQIKDGAERALTPDGQGRQHLSRDLNKEDAALQICGQGKGCEVGMSMSYWRNSKETGGVVRAGGRQR